MSASIRGQKRRRHRRPVSAATRETCYVCGWWGYAPAAFTTRNRRRVCRDVQACTDRVFNPPPPDRFESIRTAFDKEAAQ